MITWRALKEIPLSIRCELQHKPNTCFKSSWICETLSLNHTKLWMMLPFQKARTAQHLLPVAVVWAACAGLHPSSSIAYLILTFFFGLCWIPRLSLILKWPCSSRETSPHSNKCYQHQITALWYPVLSCICFKASQEPLATLRKLLTWG